MNPINCYLSLYFFVISSRIQALEFELLWTATMGLCKRFWHTRVISRNKMKFHSSTYKNTKCSRIWFSCFFKDSQKWYRYVRIYFWHISTKNVSFVHFEKSFGKFYTKLFTFGVETFKFSCNGCTFYSWSTLCDSWREQHTKYCQKWAAKISTDLVAW